MYVTRFSSLNLRLFANQQIDFLRNGKPRMWTVFVGDNGLCKSTLLQAIAIGSNGPTLANAWVGEARSFAGPAGPGMQVAVDLVLPQSLAREFEDALAMRYRLVTEKLDDQGQAQVSESDDQPSPRPPAQVLSTCFIADRTYTFAGKPHAVKVIDALRSRRLSGAFQCGYGAQRRQSRLGELRELDNPARDRSASLFEPAYPVRGLNLAANLRRELGETAMEAFFDAVTLILIEVLPPDGLVPVTETSGTKQANGSTVLTGYDYFFARYGSGLPSLKPEQLSDGYQSMIAWIADLIGHYALDAGKVVPPADMQGVVLLDEIDLHLHPTWQRRIVPILKRVFPKLQFIVTTHSPLVLTGFEADEIIRLEFGDDGLVHATPGRLETGLMDATEALDSYFGVLEQGNAAVLRLRDEWGELKASTRRTPKQTARLEALEAQLARYYRGRGRRT